MESFKERQPSGSLKISQDVVATIAQVAALEIPGIASLPQHTSGFGRRLFNKLGKQPIHVEVRDDFVEITLSVALEYGAKITESCTAVQTAVKENVQTMTGMAVSKVNVLVGKIVFPEDLATEGAE